MKGPLDRTKVVLRHLPHTISQSVLMGQIDDRFSGRYNWFCFRSGNQSLKCQSYSRAYIDFKQAEDVIEFAEFFDGHVFVNEKGTQYKTIVEYAPSQRVPKRRSTKDGREGTIGKDPEYLEYLEFVSKPVENLPSAEIQLERKEAERAGAAKETPIVTALMDFVRQRRAAKGGPGRSLPNGKLVRRNAASSPSSSSATVVKRGSRKRATSTMYISRDSGKSTIGKEKSTYAKRDDIQVSEKSSAASGNVVPEEEKGTIGVFETGEKKILLLKGKEKEIPHVTTGVTPLQNSSSIKLAYDSGTGRQNRRHEATGRIIRSILLKKDAHQFQSSAVQLEKNQTLNQNKDRKPPRPQNVPSLSNGLPDDVIHGHDAHGFYIEKLDKLTRTKDKTDCGVWTPLRRSDGAHASDESMSSLTSQSTKVLPDSAEGSHKHSGRRISSHSAKDADGSSNGNEGKPLKRGVSVVSASHEKRVWVQKPSSGS